MRHHEAYVFDLDGVVRDFTVGDTAPGIELALGLPAGHVGTTAFRSDLLLPAITGRHSFEQWYDAVCAELAEASGRDVRDQMRAWRDHRGAPVKPTVALIESLRAAGHRTYLFTNGTDLVPAELDLLGLTRLFDRVLNSAVLGVAKPDLRAYALAHRAIEVDVACMVEPRAVWFTDDRADNVAAARDFGWDAELFTRWPL